MKDHISSFITVFVSHLGGVMLGFLAQIIMLNPIRMFTQDFSTRGLLSFLIHDIVTFLALYVMLRRTGYSWNRAGERMLPVNCIVYSCASAILLTAIVLISDLGWSFLYLNTSSFLDFLYAETESTGAAGMLGITTLQEKYYVQTVFVLLMHTILYIGFMLLGYYHGAKKRVAERADMIHKE